LVTSVPADFANVSRASGLGALRRTMTLMLIMTLLLALILTVPLLLTGWSWRQSLCAGHRFAPQRQPLGMTAFVHPSGTHGQWGHKSYAVNHKPIRRRICGE
jgi:hypothetical protein